MIDYTSLRNTDIYLIDQILKERYAQDQRILDAGCGEGRNIPWFKEMGLQVFGIDQNINKITHCQATNSDIVQQFQVGDLDELPYPDQSFDHVVCSAVLHFANNTEHFKTMFSELARVLKCNGSLFIRMTTDEGLPEKPPAIEDGVYYLKDDTKRFLLTRELLSQMMKEHKLALLEPFKTTLVEDLRSMATIVLMKL